MRARVRALSLFIQRRSWPTPVSPEIAVLVHGSSPEVANPGDPGAAEKRHSELQFNSQANIYHIFRPCN
jgi:hypothetical protein